MNLLKKQSLLFVFVAAIFFSVQINAAVKLPRLISDGMVLQRDVPLKIWGWAAPSEKVKIEFIGKTYQTKADKQGNWKSNYRQLLLVVLII
jgi:sialate O-acetylesterase